MRLNAVSIWELTLGTVSLNGRSVCLRHLSDGIILRGFVKEKRIMSEIHMNTRIRLINLAPWPVYFSRVNTLGDISIQQGGTFMIDREELLAQCYNNNPLFMGTDGKGSHATVVIDDVEFKKQFDFPEDQEVLTDERLEKIFQYKRIADFQKAIKNGVVRDYEAHRLIDFIKRKQVNDYNKVRFVEEFTGLKVQ